MPTETTIMNEANQIVIGLQSQLVAANDRIRDLEEQLASKKSKKTGGEKEK